MGPKVKEERGHQSPPIRMAVRVVVKLTGAGSESQGSRPSGPRERAGQAPHGALASGSRGGTRTSHSRRTTGWTEGPASHALCPRGEGHRKPGSRRGGPAGLTRAGMQIGSNDTAPRPFSPPRPSYIFRRSHRNAPHCRAFDGNQRFERPIRAAVGRVVAAKGELRLNIEKYTERARGVSSRARSRWPSAAATSSSRRFTCSRC